MDDRKFQQMILICVRNRDPPAARYPALLSQLRSFCVHVLEQISKYFSISCILLFPCSYLDSVHNIGNNIYLLLLLPPFILHSSPTSQNEQHKVPHSLTVPISDLPAYQVCLKNTYHMELER